MPSNQPISKIVRRAVVAAYTRGHSIAEIARVHEIAQSSVHRFVAEAGVPRRPMGRPSGPRPTGLEKEMYPCTPTSP